MVSVDSFIFLCLFTGTSSFIHLSWFSFHLQVFDNSMTLSGEITCCGIQKRPAIGYLSQLESLHYCEVGGYYKSPLFPIWVIGSTSHFSVLFGGAACMQESQSDLLLERCRRAFKKAEDGGESGFILVDKFSLVVDELDLRQKLGGDHGIQTLQAFLEVSGAGIILWEDAWKSLSRLLTGSSLESIIDTSDVVFAGTANLQETTAVASATKTPTALSDEELARKLAEEWGTANLGDQTLTGTSHTNSFAVDSDEALARSLESEWDQEAFPPVDDAFAKFVEEVDKTVIQLTDDQETMEGAAASKRPPTPPTDNYRPSDFEQYGSSFQLYHYNGLRGGALTPFTVTRLNASEAVGSSIGLSNGTSHHGSDDLEAVVRTKWPSCTFDWQGKTAPYID